MSAPSAKSLLAWYDRHRRDLPWRARVGATPDPYAVWLSEIMLQQTTVATVKAYYEKFLARWPRVDDLAVSPVEEVMKEWAGLGYYSRARNLHACSRAVVDQHGGRFPADEGQLLPLPGIGPYTAAAIAAIAFDRRAIVVDGNVERVAARLFAIEEPLPGAKAVIRSRMEKLTPHARCGDFAQAMMDLGATICTPRNPACALCPFREACVARAQGDMEKYPLKAPKKARPHRAGAVFYLRRDDGAVLTRLRPPKGLLGGMRELPGTEWRENFDVSVARQSAPLKADWRPLNEHVEHVFTHFSLRLAIFVAAARHGAKAPAGMEWTAESALAGEAFPTLFRKAIDLARRA